MKSNPYYTGNPANRSFERWRSLPTLDFDEMNRPDGYIAGDDLKAAVNVALTLGQPLLLTGEPGTGKTQLAASVANELGLDRPLRFETKSTTEGRDLFYTFDTVGRFHAAQSGSAVADAVRFITYQALGLSVILANEREHVENLLPPGFVHPGRRRSVVLIDEVDKAPRDVPNDILNEIEAMFFRIPELGNESVKADPAWRPIVFITSNSERALPDAFLRRCIYFHLEMPSAAQLRDIVDSRIGRRFAADGSLLDDALSFFAFVRQPQQSLRKPPGPAELLNWLSALADGLDGSPVPLREHPQLVHTLRCTMLKTREDQARSERLIQEWGGS